jgi:hypothetical protein
LSILNGKVYRIPPGNTEASCGPQPLPNLQADIKEGRRRGRECRHSRRTYIIEWKECSIYSLQQMYQRFNKRQRQVYSEQAEPSHRMHQPTTGMAQWPTPASHASTGTEEPEEGNTGGKGDGERTGRQRQSQTPGRRQRRL